MIDSTIFYKTLTVLYIDSNKITATYFSGVLEKLFKNVIVKNSAKEAITCFLEDKNKNIDVNDIYDVLLLRFITNNIKEAYLAL